MAKMNDATPWLLPITINASGTRSNTFQTSGTWVDRDIQVSITTPAGSYDAYGGGLSITSTNLGITPTVTLSDGNDKNITNYTIGSKNTSTYAYYVKINGGSSTGSKAITATRAAVTKSAAAGWVNQNSGTQAIASANATATVSVKAGSGSTYVNIKAATLANAETQGTTYTDISSTGPILISNDYLYINAGYIPATKISLARLVPDLEGLVQGGAVNMRAGYSLYDKDGKIVTGTMQDSTGGGLSGGGSWNLTAHVLNTSTSTVDTSTITMTDQTSGYYKIGIQSASISKTVTRAAITAGYTVAKNADTQTVTITCPADIIYIKAANYSVACTKTNPSVACSKTTNMVSATSGTYYVQDNSTVTNGSHTATATINNAGYVPTGSKSTTTEAIGASVTGQGKIYIPTSTISAAGSVTTSPSVVISNNPTNLISSLTTTTYGLGTSTTSNSNGTVGVKHNATAGYTPVLTNVADSNVSVTAVVTIGGTQYISGVTIQSGDTGNFTVNDGTYTWTWKKDANGNVWVV